VDQRLAGVPAAHFGTDGVSSEGEAAFRTVTWGQPRGLTGADASSVERRSYGRVRSRRNPNDWLLSATNTSPVHLASTSHEEDREYGYVNNDGRLYDR